jgi:hypothetical protein
VYWKTCIVYLDDNEAVSKYAHGLGQREEHCQGVEPNQADPDHTVATECRHQAWEHGQLSFNNAPSSHNLAQGDKLC